AARDRLLADAAAREGAQAEVLRTIAHSPAGLPAVLDALVEHASRLCAADYATLQLVRGDCLETAAVSGAGGGRRPRPDQRLARGRVSGRAVLERRTVSVADAAALPEDEFPLTREIQRRAGFRSLVATPLLRGGAAIGVLNLLRYTVRPFADREL